MYQRSAPKKNRLKTPNTQMRKAVSFLGFAYFFAGLFGFTGDSLAVTKREILCSTESPLSEEAVSLVKSLAKSERKDYLNQQRKLIQNKIHLELVELKLSKSISDLEAMYQKLLADPQINAEALTYTSLQSEILRVLVKKHRKLKVLLKTSQISTAIVPKDKTPDLKMMLNTKLATLYAANPLIGRHIDNDSLGIPKKLARLLIEELQIDFYDNIDDIIDNKLEEISNKDTNRRSTAEILQTISILDRIITEEILTPASSLQLSPLGLEALKSVVLTLISDQKKFLESNLARDPSYIQDFPEIVDLYLMENQENLSVEDYVGLCKASFGISKLRRLEMLSSFAGHTLFLMAAFWAPPLIVPSIISHTIRFSSEAYRDFKQISSHRAYSTSDGYYSFFKGIGMVARAFEIVGTGVGLNHLSKAMQGRSFVSLLYPVNMNPASKDYLVYIYGNVMTNIFFAWSLLKENKNPLLEPAYYSDTISNMVIYNTLSQISKSITRGNNSPWIAGIKALPIALILLAIDDYIHSIHHVINSRYQKSEKSSEFFLNVAFSYGLANLYLGGIQNSIIAHATENLSHIMPTGWIYHVLNIARSTFIYLPAYDIAAMIMKNPEVSYWEGFRKVNLHYLQEALKIRNMIHKNQNHETN